MDVAVWNTLHHDDQQKVSALIEALPQLLQSLQAEGIDPKRDWQDWYKLVQDIRDIHKSLATT